MYKIERRCTADFYAKYSLFASLQRNVGVLENKECFLVAQSADNQQSIHRPARRNVHPVLAGQEAFTDRSRAALR